MCGDWKPYVVGSSSPLSGSGAGVPGSGLGEGLSGAARSDSALRCLTASRTHRRHSTCSSSLPAYTNTLLASVDMQKLWAMDAISGGESVN